MSINQTSYSSARWNEADYANILAACQKRMTAIRVGGTRKDLLEVFTEAGGFSTRNSRHYVYKDSPHIRVDVEFDAVQNKEDMSAEHPSDRIRTISKPYISPVVCD